VNAADWRALAAANFRLWIRLVSKVVIGALVVFGLIYGYGRYTEWRARNQTDWKAKYAESQDSVDMYRKASKRDSIQYRDKIVPEYIHIRDAALAQPNVPTSTKTAYSACDVVRSACEAAQDTLRGQIRGLERENDLLRNQPGPARITGYGELDYDVIGLRPVVRLGGNVKIVGPLNLRLEGEYAVPSQLRPGHEDGFRVLVGGRIYFNK
jgi:hypothetical protein